MAKIWYVNKGPNPTQACPGPRCELPLIKCIELFNEDNIKRIEEKGLKNGTPKFESNNSRLDGFEPEIVILECSDEDISAPPPRKTIGFRRIYEEGFYRVHLPINKVETLLRDATH